MWVLFSDLDGTLLDRETYSFEPAAEALEEIRRRGIPLVLISSKTRAEIEQIREMLGNSDPFVAENGGGVFLPRTAVLEPPQDAVPRGDYFLIQLGASHQQLAEALDRASRNSGVPIRAFHDMSTDEITETTGLPYEAAALARYREFGAPFLIPDRERASELLAEIEHLGFQWTHGGRFFHILGNSSKGRAIDLLREVFRKYGEIRTVGLGDASNDVEFLIKTDHPVIIPSERLEEMKTRLPHATIAPEPGPSGWNRVVLELLRSEQDC